MMVELNTMKPANQISLSIGAIEMVRATASFPMTSKILIQAKADIFSCATIVPVQGILINESAKDIIEN